MTPRLLGVLEADGTKVDPTLVHGDLWEGNCSVDADTGAPMIFDGTPGTHTMSPLSDELGPWLCPRHKFPPYIDEYVKHLPASAPTEEFWDRIGLFCLLVKS
ncbi:uncharacterized protein PG998_006122 [Apiospora kogelbergensis]|uniref:uncharacterized protein n=1 Tax=Apiospora kogelbergensis TaxID=1337665 RepID=UPI003131B3E1